MTDKLRRISQNEAETLALGEALGRHVPPHSVLAFWGDLGAGKTVFVKGFAKGLGIQERIKSPTFVLLEEYVGRLPFAHIDAYRIQAEEAAAAGLLECFEKEGVVAVEWAENLGDFLPADALRIKIESHYDGDHEWRILEFSYLPAQAAWLMAALADLPLVKEADACEF